MSRRGRGEVVAKRISAFDTEHEDTVARRAYASREQGFICRGRYAACPIEGKLRPRGKTVKMHLAAVATVVLLGACNKNNEKTTADTATMRAADTVKPTTDTVVKTTTTTTDTIKGKPADTTKAATKTAKTTKATKSTSKKKPYGSP
jgi:hypothetical protein